jgi:polysaccharide biosynthesis transport protein
MEPDDNRYDDETTLADNLQILKRRKWSLCIPAFLIFCIATAVTLGLSPIYRASATILIEEQEVPAEFVRATVTSYAAERIQMIKQRVMSFSRLNELVNRFNLYPERRTTWPAEKIVAKMREDIRVEPVSAEVKDPRTGRASTATIAFTLSYEGKNPETVLQVANTLTSLFLSENQQVRERQTAETSQFLEVEMSRVRKELAALDNSIADFKQAHMQELPELLQINLEGKARTERDVERLADQLRTLNDRKGFLQSQIDSLSLNFGNQDKKRLEDLKIELINLKARVSDEHPDVIKTRREIVDLEKQISIARPGRESSSDAAPIDSDNPAFVTLNTQLASTGFEIESIHRQIQDLNQRARQYSQRLEATPNVEKAYNALAVERHNTQAKYNDLMAKYMESQVAHGLEKERKGERFTLIDPARYPEQPVKPNRKAMLLIGVVLAIGGGLGFAALREVTDNSVRDLQRLSRTMPYPVLAAIPFIETRADIMRRRITTAAIALGVIIAIAGSLLVFHHFLMDLDMLWAKIYARLSFI